MDIFFIVILVTARHRSGDLRQEAELRIAQKIFETEKILLLKSAFISPYSDQAPKAKELLPKEMRISTIDSFQGQEEETIILSLVRSNDTGEIGFLKDFRRMNVAITKAKEQLFVIGTVPLLVRMLFTMRFCVIMKSMGIIGLFRSLRCSYCKL